ncbi:MAG: cellulase family glycosylhydrolase [Acidobacteriaceae bacterium]|nr:cellulase family glycosylhydrolase [Acidobacteriaceae bacterium]
MNIGTRRFFLQSSVAATFTAATILRNPSLAWATHPQSTSAKLRFGVNYVPRKHWLYGWLDWDRQSVAEDLQAIAALGMDHIRVQCLWSIFQPGINYVSETVLERLHTLLDIADTAGLDVEVTVLNGWMSGMSFLPAWVQPLTPKRNIFTDPEIVQAEDLLFTRIASVISLHPRFLGFDIGNELPVLQHLNNPVTSPDADAWAEHKFGLCNQIAPGKLHVNGVDHKPWFSDFGFTRQNLATTGGASILHCYGFFTGALQRFGLTGVGNYHLIEYMTEFAYAYQADLARKVWVEEVGVAGAGDELTSETAMGEYMDQLIRNGVGTGKLWGFTWWGSHDIDRGIKGFASLEYPLGLIGQDNKPKPLGKKFAALAAEMRKSSSIDSRRTVALVVPDLGLGGNTPGPDWTYGDRFMKLVVEGKTPAIVLESRSKDEAYLRARGIKELV